MLFGSVAMVNRWWPTIIVDTSVQATLNHHNLPNN